MPAFAVADRAAGALDGRLHLLARLRRSSAGDGDSSTSFWWRRWIEHSRSPSVSTPPVRVAQHLDLDVPRRDTTFSR